MLEKSANVRGDTETLPTRLTILADVPTLIRTCSCRGRLGPAERPALRLPCHGPSPHQNGPTMAMCFPTRFCVLSPRLVGSLSLPASGSPVVSSLLHVATTWLGVFASLCLSLQPEVIPRLGRPELGSDSFAVSLFVSSSVSASLLLVLFF